MTMLVLSMRLDREASYVVHPIWWRIVHAADQDMSMCALTCSLAHWPQT